ncbi:DNA invertase Pin-like site-specific DNA recombinase [Sphingobium sp. OAS761]|nr:DNA invertase Pin-like site-specific DNA recombinase [Sphingobium sp. OAS761]
MKIRRMKAFPTRIGYARVSTGDQDLALQIEALKQAGCAQSFADQGVSGAACERDGLRDALAALEPGHVLVVWKLDRLGRSLRFLLDFIEGLHARGCGFVSLTEGFDTTTNTGKLVFHILAAIGEFERGLISERTRAGMQAARLQGRKAGRPSRLTEQQITEAQRLVSTERRPIADLARDLDVSYDTLRRNLRRFDLAA